MPKEAVNCFLYVKKVYVLVRKENKAKLYARLLRSVVRINLLSVKLCKRKK